MKLFRKDWKNGRIITVVIPVHNQQDIVELNIKYLNKQTVKPDYILLVNDHSKRFTIRESGNVKIHNLEKRGRVHNRNKGLDIAINELNSDIVIFMDGDSIPEHKNYIKNYLIHNLDKPVMYFGTRYHIPRPVRFKEFNTDLDYEYKRIKKFPSDLLTANLDKKWNFHNEDLRIVSEIYPRFNKIEDFTEKANMLMTGMVTWSCNFLITRDAALMLKDFMEDVYDIDGWFDYNTFGISWGGEDNAFGLDAHYAGIDIKITKKSRIMHFMHERTDSLFTHIKLNNLLMNRYLYLRDLKK